MINPFQVPTDRREFSPPANIKNAKGEFGEICNNCGGYGFTNGIKGSSTCPDCRGDGIKAVNVRELETQVKKLTLLVGDLIYTLQKHKIFVVQHREG